MCGTPSLGRCNRNAPDPFRATQGCHAINDQVICSSESRTQATATMPYVYRGGGGGLEGWGVWVRGQKKSLCT